MKELSTSLQTKTKHPSRDEDGWCWNAGTRLGKVTLSTGAIKAKNGESYWVIEVGDLSPSSWTVFRALMPRNPSSESVIAPLKAEVEQMVRKLSSVSGIRWINEEIRLTEFSNFDGAPDFIKAAPSD
jgi:hypothetical protein